MSPAPDSEFLLLTGADLHPATIRARFAKTPAKSQQSVRVPYAYLSFAQLGVPFLEPALSGAILEGVNDGTAPSPRDSTAYKRWLWERCAPGMEFRNELPPALEGVIFEFDNDIWSKLKPTLPPLISVEVRAYQNGDPALDAGTFHAWYAQPTPSSLLLANLTPSEKVLRACIVGGFFSMLSQPYMSHLSQLRHYAPPLTKRLAARVLQLLVLPQFVLFHLPQLLLNRFVGLSISPGGGLLGRWSSDLGFFFLRRAEWCGRTLIGSGYRNETART